MRLWLQIVLAIGILAVSAASGVYVWRSIQSYRLEKEAAWICDHIVASNSDDYKQVFALKMCENRYLGKTRD